MIVSGLLEVLQLCTSNIHREYHLRADEGLFRN